MDEYYYKEIYLYRMNEIMRMKQDSAKLISTYKKYRKFGLITIVMGACILLTIPFFNIVSLLTAIAFFLVGLFLFYKASETVNEMQAIRVPLKHYIDFLSTKRTIKMHAFDENMHFINQVEIEYEDLSADEIAERIRPLLCDRESCQIVISICSPHVTREQEKYRENILLERKVTEYREQLKRSGASND